MNEAATAYVLRYNWPAGGIHAMTPEQLQKLLHDAFAAGYTEGRKPNDPR